MLLFLNDSKNKQGPLAARSKSNLIVWLLSGVVALNAGYAMASNGAMAVDNHAQYNVATKKSSATIRGTGDPVAEYETYVPNKTPRLIPFFEFAILKSYLDNNTNKNAIQTLAIYHLNQSLLNDFRSFSSKKNGGEAVRHSVIAQYFLNRCLDLGCKASWVRKSLNQLERSLDRLNMDRAGDDTAMTNADENHPSHLFFRDSFFNNHEEKRYEVVSALLNDFFLHPNNMLTNTYLTTATIWNGGEANYSDPGILYDFILSSYFSIRTLHLAEQAEELWSQDPNNNKRFRLAGNIGGWTVPARRWLAKFHGDQKAVDLLDAEHRLWLDINPQFISVPVGLMLFEESPEKVAEGYAAWVRGFDACNAHPQHLSCVHWPRATFNYLPFVLAQADFLMKFGQVEAARGLLAVRNIPIDIFAGLFPSWDLGQGPWLHREQNLERIVELYQNNDPSDDPSNFLLKQHKWGPGTFVCQTCHQRQSKVWADGDVEKTLAEVDEFPPIGRGNWPDAMTSWYGSSTR